MGGHVGEPAPKGLGLALAERAQGHIDVALHDINPSDTRRHGGVPGNVPGAFTVADDPYLLRPVLHPPGSRRPFGAEQPNKSNFTLLVPEASTST
jgi:hypothetical protein